MGGLVRDAGTSWPEDHPELQTFWQDIDRGTRFLAGEEYVEFSGDPVAQAAAYAQPQQALANSGGAIRIGLSKRYITGMTPGWKLGGGLGGNIHGWPLAKTNAWRDRFITARIQAQKPAGYAQFYFIDENALPEHIDAAIETLHRAATRHVA